MTSGTVTSVASPIAIPERIAGHIFESSLLLVCKVAYWLSAQHCLMWDDVSRISNDVKLFPHRPVYGLASPRAVFVLSRNAQTKGTARETSYESVRCFLFSLFCESLFLCIWCSRRGLKTIPGFRSLYFSAFIRLQDTVLRLVKL